MALETGLEVVQRLLPLLLRHEHLATALINDANHTWVLNRRHEVLTQSENLLHPPLLFRLDTHLNLKCKHL